MPRRRWGRTQTCGNAIPSPAKSGYNPSAPIGQSPVSGFLQCYYVAMVFIKKDDRLPKFFMQEQLPEAGNIFDVPEGELDSVVQIVESLLYRENKSVQRVENKK